MTILRRCVLLVGILMMFPAIDSMAGLPASEKAALVALYNSTDGDNWTNNEGWLGEYGPCGEDSSGCIERDEWYGVYCKHTDSFESETCSDGYGFNTIHVIDLILRYNHLRGSILLDGDFPNLKLFNVDGNLLTSISLKNLPSLHDYFYSFENELTSLSLENLPSMVGIRVGDDKLTSISLKDLPKLEVLALKGGKLKADIATDIGKLTSLKTLELGGNEIAGDMPSDFEKLVKLEILYLGNNLLTSFSLKDFPNLGYLDLSYNPLTTLSLENLPSLFTYGTTDYSGNQLTSLSLKNLPSLRGICHYTGQLKSVLLEELPKLETLVLADNEIGEIPPDIFNMTNLRQINLSHNQLIGEIPPEFGDFSSLENLYLSGNKLRGEIPSELGNLSTLQTLFLYNNQLRGLLPPSLTSLTNLQEGWTNICSNYLYTDNNAVRDFFNLKTGFDWEACQYPDALACTKEFNREYALQGDEIIAKVVIDNLGGSETFVKVTDTLAKGLTFVKAETELPSNVSGQVRTWEKLGPIKAGESLTLEYKINIEIDPKLVGKELCNSVETASTVEESAITSCEACVKSCAKIDIPKMYQSGEYANAWRYKTYDHIPEDSKEQKHTIGWQGCSLVSSVMIINHHGGATDPNKLNDWLKKNGGYNASHHIIWKKIEEYAREAEKLNISIKTLKKDDSLLNQLLCEGHPQILKVNDGGHFVVAAGRVPNFQQGLPYIRTPHGWWVNDPGYNKRKESYDDYKEMVVILPGSISLRAIVASLSAPAELLVTNPQEGTTGFDPNAVQQLEQMQSDSASSGVYYSSFIRDEDGHAIPESKIIEIQDPSNGVYEFQITGTPYPSPKISYANVRSFLKPDGSTGTSFVMRIFGPSPEDVQSITATGSSGTFHLNPSNTSREFGLYYVYSQERIVTDGDYTFAVVDTLGRTTSVVRNFAYNDTLPQVNSTSMVPANNAYVGTTTPTLNFDPVEDGVYYDVLVFDYDYKAMWYHSGTGQSTTYTVPEGILQPDTAYLWWVRVYDGNTEVSARNYHESERFAFYTGTKADPELTAGGVMSLPVGENFQYLLNYGYARGVNVAPWDINYFKATGPDSTVFNFANKRSYSFQSSAANVAEVYLDPPTQSVPDGAYTVEIADNSGHTATSASNYAYNPVPDFSTDSRVPANNAYLDSNTPAFSWARVAGDPGDGSYRYTIRIVDYANKIQWYNSPLSANTSFTLPADLNLPRGTSYKWRVNVYGPTGSGGTDSNNYRMSDYHTFTINDSSAPASSGTYVLEVLVYDEQGQSSKQVFTGAIEPGMAAKHAVNYSLAVPSCATTAASSITTTTAVLNGKVNPNGSDAAVVFEWGTSESYGNEVIATQSPLSGNTEQAVSAFLKGLPRGTTHHFRVKATNTAGTSHGTNETFATSSLAESEPFQITKIDTDCTHYATFQSHNQKVVQNDNGIFLTYLLDHVNSYPWTGHWWLMRSIDGGQSFSALISSPELGSSAPALATDRNNNLFLVCQTEPENRMVFYRFAANSNYTDFTKTEIDGAGSGKYTMVYDEVRNRIFIFNHYGKLFILNPDTGQLITSKQVMNPYGRNAQIMYPYLSLAIDGVLHHAWTTDHLSEYLYWDIHYAQSPDGGVSWQKADGTSLPSLFNPDDSGPADQIILPDEYKVHTWLSNMIAKNGKVHFAYDAYEINRQHYVRIDLSTGRIDKNVYPTWSSDTISVDSSSGFFATRKNDPNAPLVFVGSNWPGILVALISWNNGDTWSDLATTNFPTTGNIYAVGGSAEITDDGYVIGSFTDQHDEKGDPYFFKISLSEVSDIYVNKDDGTCGGKSPCYTSIQAGINAAKVWATIKIAQGTYTEPIALNTSKSLTLQGGWDSSFTTQTPNTTFIKAPKALQGSITLQMVTVKP